MIHRRQTSCFHARLGVILLGCGTLTYVARSRQSGTSKRIDLTSLVSGLLTSRFRRLKKDGQLAGIFPPDPDVDLATQELFEQFYDSHGKPNDAEKALLEQAGHVNVETIDKWCK